MRTLTVTDRDAGQRLDKYLQKYLAQAPKSFLYKMLRKKNITCNQKKCDGSERIREEDVIQLFLAEETIEKFRAPLQTGRLQTDIPLAVLYEDPHVLILNKPAGMLSQKANPEDVSLVEYLISYLLKNGSVTEESLRSFHPSVCNRLDRNTSGLITAGKTLAGASALSALFRERTARKYYLCLVFGILEKKQTIHGFLVKDEQTNQVHIFKERQEGSSEIWTAYEPISSGNGLTLLKVELITGRSHQIRAHLATLHHPVIGDRKYGNSEINRHFQKAYHLEHQLLHAWYMEFPVMEGALSGLSGKTILAPPSKLWERILAGEGLDRKGLI